MVSLKAFQVFSVFLVCFVSHFDPVYPCVRVFVQRMYVPFQLFQRSQMVPHHPRSQRGGAGPPVHPTRFRTPTRKCLGNNPLTSCGGLPLPRVSAIQFGSHKIIKYVKDCLVCNMYGFRVCDCYSYLCYII